MRGTKEQADEIYRGTLQKEKIDQLNQDSHRLQKLTKVEVY